MIKVFTATSLHPLDELSEYLDDLEELGYEVDDVKRIERSWLSIGEDAWQITCHKEEK